jgi:hypothetical protein
MLYAGSGSPIPNDTMEQDNRKWITDRTPAASEANFYSNVEVPASSRSSEPITSSGRRFTKFYTIKRGEPWLPASIEYYKDRQALVAKGYEQGLAAGRAEQQAMAKLPTDSDYDAPQSLHSVALDMVDSLGRSFNLLPEILDTLRRAIREPMAEQQATCKAGLQVADDLTPEPEPEPILGWRNVDFVGSPPSPYATWWEWASSSLGRRVIQDVRIEAVMPRLDQPGATEPTPEPEPIPSPAAGDAGLVEVVVRAMRAAPLGYQPEARAAIRAVARWLRSNDYPIAASLLKQEANR